MPSHSYGSINNSDTEEDPLLAPEESRKDSKPEPFILETTPLNPLSALTFQWFVPLLKIGNAKDRLDPEDLKQIPLPPSCETKNAMAEFEKYWKEDVREYKLAQQDQKKEREPSLAWCLTKAFIKDYIKAGFLKLIHDINVFVGPIVLHGLIQFLRDPYANMQEGIVLTATVTVSQILMSFCLRHYFFKCYLTGLRMRTAVVMAVYKKALILSSTERQKRSVGEIVNLMTVDAQRIQDLTTYGHAVWYSFLQIGLAIYFLWQQLGPSCLGGVAVIIVMVPVNKFIAGWMGRLQKKLMKARDQRVDVNNEVLCSMKVIKLQAWEDSFQKRILNLRNIELKQLFNYVMANSFSIMMWTAVPLLVALATFTTYTLSGHDLDVANALTALSLFDILRFPLFMLPQVINNLVEASVSFGRVKMFLLGEEYVPVGEGNISGDAGIEMERATFVYDSKKPKMKTTEKQRRPEVEKMYQELHDKDWEIKLLKAQLADAETNLMSIANTNHEKEMTVPLVDKEFSQMKASSETEPIVEEDSLENLLALRRVNFQCKRGELIAVVGSVGSGKTTFVNSILGEVRALSGTVAVKGRLAYCTQLPFIVNDTVQKNILFGRRNESLDNERYKLALNTCELKHDLELLSNGDQTEIGEKGITLSGGQKARVGMARAVYHDADIYLLDDPLAAVDAHVGKHLFQKCIIDELLLNKSRDSDGLSKKKNSVILVTNALQYLSDPNVDRIVVLDDGVVVEEGSYNELKSNPESLFSAFISVVLDNGMQEAEASEGEESDDDVDTVAEEQPPWMGVVNQFVNKLTPNKKSVDSTEIFESKDIGDVPTTSSSVVSSAQLQRKHKDSISSTTSIKLQRSVSSFSRKDSTRPSIISAKSDDKPSPFTPLTTSELDEREKGNVSFDVYLGWAKAAGGTAVATLVLFGYVVDQGLSVASKWWLTYWSKNGNSSPNAAKEFLVVYALINVAAILAMLLRVILIMLSGLRASKILFIDLLDCVLQAPMSFFDTTPTGRIINRFSKDMFTVDEKLVSTMRSYLATFSNVVGVIIVISYITPVFTICLIPMIAFYIKQQSYFTTTYRELRRLDSVNRSPLYALLGETLDGVSTIRAYNAESALVSEILSMLDNQQSAYFLTCTAQCWLAIRLEMVGTLIISSACLCAVLQHGTQGGNPTFAGLAGLSISFALSVTQSLNWSVRMSSDLEANMVSTERIRQYCRIQSEAPHSLPSDSSLKYTWPSDGKIVFSSAKLRYRPGLPLVLKGLDIEIPPNSKVGVVGRTGAGKSTLMVSLLRIVELSSGSITIDGIDITKVGLKMLRSKIAVIPQDPVLFSGTIRTNLDPFNDFEDARLEEVLQRVGLKASGMTQSSSSQSLTSMNSLASSKSASPLGSNIAVKSLSDEVLEGGSNFSVGQRQLLVIARSLLRGAKIVIMDEATASVDADTDARIQRVMRTEFKDSTCITVAHRINTILDSDYILVMDDGQAAEFDAPDTLLAKGGLFKDLVNAWDEEHGSKSG